MSYSFAVTGASKAEAKEAVAAKFAEVVAGQPNHEVDRNAAVAAAGAFIDMLADTPEGFEVQVRVNGSLGWRADNEYYSAAVNIDASLRSKVAE